MVLSLGPMNSSQLAQLTGCTVPAHRRSVLVLIAAGTSAVYGHDAARSRYPARRLWRILGGRQALLHAVPPIIHIT